MTSDSQVYLQYIDNESGVVKRPEGTGWDDPFGDGVWRSSWFYSSLLIIRSRDHATYDQICNKHGLSEDLVERFLRYFRDHNAGTTGWALPKNPTQYFSGDQLAPLLYLMTCVKSYGTAEANDIANDLLIRLIELDRNHGALSDSHQGQIRDNQRYAIDIACRMYDIEYLRGFRRELCKIEFSTALAINNQLAQLPWESLATNGSYAVFNALGLVSASCAKWGKDDEDVDSWRKSFRVHADKGWGPAFRIVSGRSISIEDIDSYATAYVTRDHDNDIIMAQRPEKYLSGEFFPDHQAGDNRWLVLDYLILKGLQLLWS